MVSRLHPQSDDAHLAGLVSAFQVPPTQIDAMASDRYQIYNQFGGCIKRRAEPDDYGRDPRVCEWQLLRPEPVAHSVQRYVCARWCDPLRLSIAIVSTMYGWTSRVFNRMNMSFGTYVCCRGL